MNLFFIYDTSYCKRDEDDPKDAVIYFFPIQATETERYLLCCQLVGIAKFLRITFSTPKIIGLDEGKFAFHWSGKYLLVLGTKSDIPSSVLQDQLSFLCGIFCFYHGSINNFFKECNNDREEFLNKMELSWSRYITLSQCFNNVLQFSVNALPVITFRKNAGIGSKANRLLQMCQFNSSVIAGVVFYNSRVLASQFPSQITNYLSLMSNYNAALPVSNIYDSRRGLPPDVELKRIYLSSKIISKIISYNHILVGTNIRVKSPRKMHSKSNSLPTNSGSEGDIDSGNCSENVQSLDVHTDETSLCKVSSMAVKWNKELNKISCCVSHTRLLKRKMLNSRNQNCLKLISDMICYDEKGNLLETDDSGIHPRLDLKDDTYSCREIKYAQGVNLLCYKHAHIQYTNIVTNLKQKSDNLLSVRDLEFYCSLCEDRNPSFNLSSLKHWNSEINLNTMKFGSSSLTLHKCFNQGKRQSNASKKSKLQILKCRSVSQSSNFLRLKHNVSSHFKHKNVSRDIHDTENSGSNSHRRLSSSFNICENYVNIENNELQKHVLYVQRYGGSTLILLLNQEYDENIITYSWNCGFSILRDIEYNAEKYLEKNSNDTEVYFHMILYENLYKLLKEYPHCLSNLTSEKWIKEAIQMIQANFRSDSNIDSLSILSANRSIYASHRDHFFAFYIQLENNSRKLESLSNLNRKAIRRLEKYFKITL